MFIRTSAGRAHHQMMIATAQASGATRRPRKTHVLYPSAVLGGTKRWIEIHRHTANPRASLNQIAEGLVDGREIFALRTGLLLLNLEHRIRLLTRF
jgi:hypothetical protein